MPSDYPRSHRVADFIQRELSGLIRTELKDPRVSPMLTVASVEVSRDLSVAKIYYALFDPEERVETQDALVRASGFLRRQLARQMNTRSVPQLRFFYDDSAEKGAYMSALIADAVASNSTDDEEQAESASADGSAADSPTERSLTSDAQQGGNESQSPASEKGE